MTTCSRSGTMSMLTIAKCRSPGMSDPSTFITQRRESAMADVEADQSALDTLERQIRARLDLAVTEGNRDLIASERRLLKQIGRLETKEEKALAAKERHAALDKAKASPPQGRTAQERSTTQGGVAARTKDKE